MRIFVLYQDPGQTENVPHSTGLQKGLVGVVHAYAAEDLDGANNIVIAHELLHTLGATDKYDPATLAPIYPAGYAQPDRDPRYPQEYAELMAGRRPLAPGEVEMPESLAGVLIGPETAAEINWLRR